MKQINITLMLLYGLLFIGCKASNDYDVQKKYDQIVTKYTELHEIASKEVDDTFFVYVRLPKYYNSSEKRFPVLYLLDGDISFNMATSVVRYLQFGKDVPDMILVAPAYGTLLNDSETNKRERDYTISEIDRFNDSGGANNYLRFLKNELIPLVDSTYRTNNDRILNGYSLGGLFTIHTLLNTPTLFRGYIAGSPYIINDLESLLKKLDTPFNSDLSKKVFITLGEYEDQQKYHAPIKILVDKMKSKKGLEIKFRLLAEGTHFSCPPEALAYGLKHIFNNRSQLEQ